MRLNLLRRILGVKRDDGTAARQKAQLHHARRLKAAADRKHQETQDEVQAARDATDASAKHASSCTTILSDILENPNGTPEAHEAGQ